MKNCLVGSLRPNYIWRHMKNEVYCTSVVGQYQKGRKVLDQDRIAFDAVNLNQIQNAIKPS